MKTVNVVNDLCKLITTSTLQCTINLMFAAVRVIVEEFGKSCQPPSQCTGSEQVRHTDQPWKRRLNNKIKYLRRELSKLVAMFQGTLQDQQTISYLHNKYLNDAVSLPVVIEAMKQKILAYVNKVHRYSERNESFHHNQQFRVNQRRFYENLISSRDLNDNNFSYDPEFVNDVLKFWNSVWGDNICHNSQAGWISSVADQLCEVDPQQ